MASTISPAVLEEEDKFLSQLEKNLYDQLNKLKVEEIALLKLIKSRRHDPQFQAEAQKSIESFLTTDKGGDYVLDAVDNLIAEESNVEESITNQQEDTDGLISEIINTSPAKAASDQGKD